MHPAVQAAFTDAMNAQQLPAADKGTNSTGPYGLLTPPKAYDEVWISSRSCIGVIMGYH